MKRSTNILLAAAILACSFASVVRADEPETPSGDRATSFQAVEGRSTEEVSGFGMMVGAYGLIWLFLFGYLRRIAGLEAKTSADIERLEQMLAEGDGPR